MKYYNIPVFVPHMGCPFDCVFCNQKRITGVGNTKPDVDGIVNEYLKFLPKEDCLIEIAFFGGSFTGIEEILQEELLGKASCYVGKNNIAGIRVSTRPDYIDTAVLERLLKYKVTTIELGVQSLDEEVLKASARGHTAEDVEKAVRLIRQYPFTLGLQMMTGLPLDTPAKSIETARKIIALKPDIVRIYPTLVIKNTRLEEMYERGEYNPQTVDEAVELCHELVSMFNDAGVKVIRTGLQNTDEISENGSVIAGPFHSAFGELVESRVYLEKIVALLDGDDEFFVNPAEVSKAVGQKRYNILKIKEKFGKNIKIIPDKNIKKGEIRKRGEQ